MQRTWLGMLVAAALLVAGLAFGSAWRPPTALPEPAPPCAVAELGGLTLTEREVETMTAAITPAPSRDEAARLLVDATLAHWVVRGWLAGSSVRARLASYRALVARLAESGQTSAQQARALLAVLARAGQELSLRPGPCSAALAQPPAVPAIDARELAALRASPQALERRARAQADQRPVVRAMLVRLTPRLERITPGPLFADELEPALGRALLGATPGRWIGPIASDSGLYLARRQEEPAARGETTSRR